MTCYLYNISADSRQLVKVDNSTPYTEAHPAVKPTAPLDIITPTFIFDYSAAALACNYLYCSEFGRYYFVTNIAVDTAGRINISCAIDVLQTYSVAIKNCHATVIRTATGGKPTMYVDSKFPVYPSKKVVTSITSAETSGSLSADGGYCYVLNTIGHTTNIPREHN